MKPKIDPNIRTFDPAKNIIQNGLQDLHVGFRSRQRAWHQDTNNLTKPKPETQRGST